MKTPGQRVLDVFDERDELHDLLEAAEAERDALREALERIIPVSPWDIDQDCRYCIGHYDWHEDNCAWLVARAVLERSK